MTISRQGFMLSDESGEAIVQRLENLRRDIGARCIFLANMQGQRIVEVGDIEKIDAATLLVLLSSGFVASTELAYRFGAGEAINLN
ncbi:MAG: hypothetical protein U9R15_07705, partial [Chloroflexota bacterium]|nr:hypothetical protein [Chloroflexota bacterium]